MGRRAQPTSASRFRGPWNHQEPYRHHARRHQTSAHARVDQSRMTSRESTGTHVTRPLVASALCTRICGTVHRGGNHCSCSFRTFQGPHSPGIRHMRCGAARSRATSHREATASQAESGVAKRILRVAERDSLSVALRGTRCILSHQSNPLVLGSSLAKPLAYLYRRS